MPSATDQLVKDITEGLISFSQTRRVDLAKIGENIEKFGKSIGTDVPMVEVLRALEMRVLLTNHAFDANLAKRAHSAHLAKEKANKLGRYKEWAQAETDRAAEDVLLKAEGKTREDKAKKTPLEKFMQALGKLVSEADIQAAELAVKSKVNAIKK